MKNSEALRIVENGVAARERELYLLRLEEADIGIEPI
jgi:hypothetical protein